MTAWLLTWLWQGVALAVSLSVALHLLPYVNAATRYVLWWAALTALVWLGWQSWPHFAVGASVASAASAGAIGARVPTIPLIDIQPLPPWALSAIGIVWASVALFHLLRIVPGLNALYRLKDECRPFPRGVEERLPLWLETTGRRARLMLCDRLPGAALLGLHEPCIAIPSSLVRELSATDLDQIILHESGHVQRRDDWMRLLQTLLESALWMHPAVFLIGRELNLEREVACDDWVVARTGSPAHYARCLSRVAEQRRARVPAPFAQALFGGNRDLLRRIDRLLDTRRNACRKPSPMTVAMGAALMAVCALQLRAFPLVTDALILPTHRAAEVVSGFPGPSAGGGHQTDSRAIAGTGPSAGEIRRSDAAINIRLKENAAITAVRPEAVRQETLLPEMVRREPVRSKVDPARDTATVTEGQGAPGEMFETQVLHGARVFEGVYQTVDAAAAAPPVTSPWRRAGDAGVGIGTATRKASVGLANSFTKAGTAIARSF